MKLSNATVLVEEQDPQTICVSIDTKILLDLCLTSLESFP